MIPGQMQKKALNSYLNNSHFTQLNKKKYNENSGLLCQIL